MSKPENNNRKTKKTNQGLTFLIIETQKPRYRKYNWRKHVKPKTAPQNILHADAIEAEINIVRQTLTDLEYGGLGITSNDVNYHLNMLSKKLQNYLK
jgi:hypothetical protein